MTTRFDLSFEAQSADWVRNIQGAMLAVFKQSVQETISRAQERIPIDTGFARGSIVGSLSEMPKLKQGVGPEDGKTYPESFQYLLAINGAKLGDTIYIGWTAYYTVYLEYGSSTQAPLGYVGISAAEWPNVVDRVTRELATRLGRA